MASYRPSTWEKLTSSVTALLIVGLVAYLAVRNVPFASPQLASLVRILVSVAAATLGATIPGFLGVNLAVAGLSIRAGGALALFIITYFYSPALAPELNPDAIPPLVHPRPVGDISKTLAPNLRFVEYQDKKQKVTVEVRALKLRAAFQGDDLKQRKEYDLTISNSSKEQRILRNFHVRWRYEEGALLSIEHGEVLTPQSKYSIKIPIDVDKAYKDQAEDVAMSPAILLPPANKSGPSVTTIRLEVYYEFDGRLDYHPASGWDIMYEISVEDDSGEKLRLLSRSWRSDRNSDWLEREAPLSLHHY